jgi:hypothetical protein
MPAAEPAQLYFVFDPTSKFAEDIGKPVKRDALTERLQSVFPSIPPDGYEIDCIPAVIFYPRDYPSDKPDPDPLPQSAFSIRFPVRENRSYQEAARLAQEFHRAAVASIRRGEEGLISINVNPTISGAAFSVPEYSVPVAPDGMAFGTLDEALLLIRANQLGLNGNTVNVVLIDSGIDQNAVPAGRFCGGWRPNPASPLLPIPPPPGQTAGEDALHGMMMVNSILSIAPRANIFDVPLIPPPKIYDIPSFLVVASATYRGILAGIQSYRAQGLFAGPWVFVNAWAIYDRRSELPFLGEYTQNLGTNGLPPPHDFIRATGEVAAENFDIVFCAGNCGEICPDGRCGPDDYGPGRGIWGANAYDQVLTAGAVRLDGTWPGYSSEGPGPTPNLWPLKPDLSAPAQFVGSAGRYPLSTGTSASAALATGVICALRSDPRWPQTRVPPYVLKLILNTTANQPNGYGWNQWLGNGVLDAEAARQVLVTVYP